MTKLVDMARTAAEKKADAKKYDPASPSSVADYSYGLQISLNDESLKKLGLTALPVPGTALRVEGIVKVTSVRESADEKAADRSAELQITHLSVEAPDEAASKAVKAMYPSAKD